MEPLRLRLENFNTYRDETIDFAGIHCAAVVGKNGHGKSSVFDGMLVALFGQGANGGPRELSNYIPTDWDADGFRVELDFRLQGIDYRVVRVYSEKRSRHLLEFSMRVGEEWRVLSGKNVRENQALIEERLRMNYETFTASAISLQGSSNIFTGTMTDSERKKILAKILDLEIWDQMAKSSGEKIKEMEASLSESVRSRDSARRAIDEIVTRMGDVDGIDDALRDARKALSEKEGLIVEVESLVSSKAEMESTIRNLRSQFEEKKTAFEREKKNLSSMADTEKGLRRRLEKAESLLEREDGIRTAAARAAALKSTIGVAEAKSRRYLDASRLFNTAREAVAKWRSGVESELSALRASIESSRRQSAVLDRVPCGDDLKSSCPLLEMAIKAQSELEKMTEKERGLASAQPPESLASALSEADRLVQEFAYDPEELKRMKDDLTAVEALCRDEPLLEGARDEKASVANDLEVLGVRIDEAQEEKERLGGEMQEIADTGRALKEKITDAGDPQARLQEIRDETRSLSASIEDMVRRSGEASEMKKQRDKLEMDLAEAEKKVSFLEEEVHAHKIFRAACGQKSGVPAVILENAVPEIERIANYFLDSIGGNGMQVLLKTQEEGKTTGIAQDVLRIVVVRNGSERVYKTYSGAEGFLVDIALRAALSKFLAHRARADIQIFVLDEGLGACEPDKQQAVIDGIISLTADFAKIFVITHIPSLQDAMPQRIEVERSVGEGSRVRVAA